MLFSYYFDVEKTHLLNCQFSVLQFVEKAEGVIDIMFSAEITEMQNGTRKKREAKTATFSFPPTLEGQTKHDIDFSRVRYGDEKKWIFTITNNKNTEQKVEVGLISNSANKNPLGLDIHSDDDEFHAELKANNLSILSQSYQPPVLTQTVTSARFERPGYPEGFGSRTASYDSAYQNYKLTEFTQSFSESLPAGAPFEVNLELAPYEVNPLQGVHIFDLYIPNLGKVRLLTNGLEYEVENGGIPETVRTFFSQDVVPSDFWNNGMTSKAKMMIKGNGQGELTIQYFDKTLIGVYDHEAAFSSMEFRGALAKDDGKENAASNPNNWLGSRVDNLTVIYSQ